MSETESNSEATVATVEEEHEKDVTVIAYSEGEYDEQREFIADVFGDLVDFDPLETYEEEERTVKVDLNIETETDDGYDININDTYKAFGRFEEEGLAAYFENQEEIPEYIDFTDETEVVEKNEHGVSKPIKEFLGQFFDGHELSELGYEPGDHSWYVCSWDRELEDTSVDADEGDTITQYCRAQTGTTIEPRRKLVHQSERTKENRYESDEELWSFEIRVHIECSTDDELDEISEKIVPPIYDKLWGVDKIDSVRLESCEQSVKKRGECYNF